MKALAAVAAAILLPLAFATTAWATPTPVLLGNAGLFAVLAGSGITNTGATTITGDVGSSPTHSETGFAACPAANCVSLTGANHNDPDPNDAVTQSAKADLITAYNNAAGQTPTQVPTELASHTYTAGVYNSASGTLGMTGTLVLDGENNADAIFIFQTATTLITGGTGNVSFIRGAQACNVFWKVGSAATLGAGSSFSGTILAHDDISLGDGVTVVGRLLAAEQGNAGAVTLIHDTITKPTTCLTQASIDAAAAAAAEAQAQAAAAANAAADAQAAAERAAAAAKEADAKAAAAAAEKAAAAAAAAESAAVAAKAAAEKAVADAAKAAIAKAAAAKAVKAANIAKAAATKARLAKTAAVKAAAVKAAKAIKLKRASVRTAEISAGFTG
jgi:hypothetical protein